MVLLVHHNMVRQWNLEQDMWRKVIFLRICSSKKQRFISLIQRHVLPKRCWIYVAVHVCRVAWRIVSDSGSDKLTQRALGV